MGKAKSDAETTSFNENRGCIEIKVTRSLSDPYNCLMKTEVVLKLNCKASV